MKKTEFNSKDLGSKDLKDLNAMLTKLNESLKKSLLEGEKTGTRELRKNIARVKTAMVAKISAKE